MPSNRRKKQKDKRDSQRRESDSNHEIATLFESPSHIRRDSRRAADLIALGEVDSKTAGILIRRLHRFGAKTKKARELVTIVGSLNKLAKLEIDHDKLRMYEQGQTVVVTKPNGKDAESAKVVDGESKRLEYHNHNHLHVEHGSPAPVESESNDRAARVHEIAAGLGITINVSDVGETGT